MSGDGCCERGLDAHNTPTLCHADACYERVRLVRRRAEKAMRVTERAASHAAKLQVRQESG